MGIMDALKLRLIPNLVYYLIIFINRTVKLKVIGEEELADLDDGKPLLFSVWHRYSWLPLYYLRNRDYIALTSTSRDGEYMTRLLHKFGWQTIRGSSTRGGARSLVKLYRKLSRGYSTGLTPDGPTGPVYKVKPGIVYLQEKTEGYIVPVGLAVNRKKIINSWDRYVIPLPFTDAVMVMGEPVRFSDTLSVEERCRLLEEEMKKVHREAEEELQRIVNLESG